MFSKITIIGNLGKDPESRTMPSGDAVCSFSVATSEKWRGKDGQMQEHTEWHNVKVWGKMADAAQRYLSKGSKVYIEGAPRTETYEKDGIRKESRSIRCTVLKFLSSKSDSATAGVPAQTVTDDDVPF